MGEAVALPPRARNALTRLPMYSSPRSGSDHKACSSARTAPLILNAPQIQWLRGAFLWKWFAGETRGETFLMSREPLRARIAAAWGGGG